MTIGFVSLWKQYQILDVCSNIRNSWQEILIPSANKRWRGIIIRLTDIFNKYVEVQGPKDRIKLRKMLNTHMRKMAVYVSFEDFEILLSKCIGLSV
jgi:hypothetical protein